MTKKNNAKDLEALKVEFENIFKSEFPEYPNRHDFVSGMSFKIGDYLTLRVDLEKGNASLYLERHENDYVSFREIPTGAIGFNPTKGVNHIVKDIKRRLLNSKVLLPIFERRNEEISNGEKALKEQTEKLKQLEALGFRFGSDKYETSGTLSSGDTLIRVHVYKGYVTFNYFSIHQGDVVSVLEYILNKEGSR